MTFPYWPDEKINQFINLMNEAPILWDRSNPDYNNKQQRDEMWNKISQKIAEPDIQALKAKMKSFRSNYRAECKKIERDSNYKPIWRFFKSLQFLDKKFATEEETDYESENVKRKITFHRWSDEKTKEFIRLFKMEPTLWNKQHPDNANLRKRELVLNEIARKLNCSVAVLKIKIKSARSTFCVERNKMAKDKNYRPIWRFFRRLTFLDNENNQVNDNCDSNDFDDDNDENAHDGSQTGNRFFWTNGRVLKFIDFLSISPQLWDREHPDHMNKKQKDIIWKNMAKEMDTTVSILELKYKNLRKQFRQHHIGVLKNKNYVPIWKFYGPLEFLASQVNVVADNELATTTTTTTIEYLDDGFLCEDSQNSFLDEAGYQADQLKKEFYGVDDECSAEKDDDDCNNSEVSSEDETSKQFEKMATEENNKLVFWSDETTIKFINLLREHPILWNKETADFGKNKKRQEHFEQLADEMGSTIAIVKAKYKRLTGEFRVEFRKLQKNPEYKPVWLFFPYLKYLAGDDFPQDFEIAEPTVQGASSSTRISRLWDDDKMLKFIKLLEKYPILYEKNRKIDNLHKKDLIWHDIAYALNDKVEMVRKKYKTLRSMCRTEYLRKKYEPNYTHTWRFWPYTKFLWKAIADEFEDQEHQVTEPEDETMELQSTSTKNSTKQQFIIWSDEQMIAFINELRKYPIIWNSKTPNYKSIPVRNGVWKKISKTLNIPDDALKTKYHTIRGQYKTECKKLSFNPNYTPCWKFYSFLKFIPLESEQTSDILQIDDKNEPTTNADSECDVLDETETCFILDYDDSGNEHISDFAFDATTNDETEEFKIDIQAIQDHDMDQTNASTRQNQQQQIQDEFTAFAEYVANEMRKMKDNRLVELTFKSKVIRAVLEANEALKEAS